MITVVVPTDWTSIMTAFGTVGAAVAAVSIAIWADWRTGKRLREQLAHSDEQLREQLKHSDQQLADERALSAQRIADEREHGEALRAEERRLTREQEQLTEAWSVEVIAARIKPDPGVTSEPDDPAGCPVAIVINRGRYTITRVQAQFSPGDNSLVGHAQTQTFTDFTSLPQPLGHDLTGAIGEVYLGVLALVPSAAVRFIGAPQLVRNLRSTFPIVRWTDRWAPTGSVAKAR